MVRDFAGWLNQIIEYWGATPSSRTVRRLIRQADFSVRKEDKYSHKRQVQPGDHRRKLKPQTIERLNSVFADIPRQLGYSDGDRSAAA
jgi:hypothetical protein